MQVALGEGNLHATIAKLFNNGLIDLRADEDVLLRVGYPNAEAHLPGRIAKGDEDDVGGGDGEDVGVAGSGGDQCLDHLFEVRVVGDPNIDVEALAAITVRPVDYALFDEFAVGHDHRGIVDGANGGGAHVDGFDIAFGSADGNPVAHGDGSFEEQEDPGNEVGSEVLEAKANTDAEGAKEDRQ